MFTWLALNYRVLARKKIKEGGVVLISKYICGFSDHIKEILPHENVGNDCICYV